MPRFPLLAFVVLCAIAAALCAQQPAPPAIHPEGATLFHESGCEHCHGTQLQGTSDHGPSLLTVGRRLKADEIHRQIREGGESMPSFADSLNEPEIDALVRFLLAHKKTPKNVKPAEPPFSEPAAGAGAPPAGGMR